MKLQLEGGARLAVQLGGGRSWLQLEGGARLAV